MSTEPLHIEEVGGSREGIRVFRLSGPLDSAAIGALVGAYVNRQKEGRRLGLVGVNPRIRQAFEITRIESLLQFYDSVVEAERAVA